MMQLLDIDLVINEIKSENPTDWKCYIEKLKDNSSFSPSIGCDHLYDKIWIQNIHNEISLVSIISWWTEDIWNWSNRDSKFKEFVKLEKIFIEKMNEKYSFCPYCWKIPLITFTNEKSERKRTYDLDHIYPKKTYNYLTYSFYNLVPICKICNQLKSTTNFYNKRHYFHPYFWYINENNKADKTMLFDDKVNFSNNSSSIDILDGAFSHNTKLYKLDKIYANAQDTKNDIEFIRDKKWHILSYGIKLDSIWIKDKKWFFFKNFYPEKSDDILRFANGKLKKDMINSLKI